MGGGGGGGGFPGSKGGRQRKGTPRNNKAQNEQTNSVASKLKLTPKQREELHRLVTGMGMGYFGNIGVFPRMVREEMRRVTMTITEHNCAKDKMSVLVGMPLHSITRAADMLCLRLGSLVETESIYRDGNGDLARRVDGGLATRKTMVGEYALHVQCHFRMRCGYDIMFAKCDLYHPTEKTASRQDDENFDVQDLGNNRLDEIVADQFASPAGFVVKRVAVNRVGDITIEFTNDFVFETQIDVSGSQECWRYFKHDDDEHLVIGAAGIIDQEG